MPAPLPNMIAVWRFNSVMTALRLVCAWLVIVVAEKSAAFCLAFTMIYYYQVEVNYGKQR